MGLFRIFILLLELKKKIDIRIAYENLSGSVIFSNIKHIFENIQELVPCYQVTWKIVHQLVYTWKLLFERLEDIQEKNVDIKSMKHIYLFIFFSNERRIEPFILFGGKTEAWMFYSVYWFLASIFN